MCMCMIFQKFKTQNFVVRDVRLDVDKKKIGDETPFFGGENHFMVVKPGDCSSLKGIVTACASLQMLFQLYEPGRLDASPVAHVEEDSMDKCTAEQARAHTITKNDHSS